MLTFVQQPESYWKKQLPFLKEQTQQKKKLVEDLIVINTHHQFLTNLKLNELKKKYEVSINRLKIMHYFESNPQHLSKDEDLLLQVMSNRSKNEAEKKGDLVQLEYEIKLEVLQAEEKILKKRLKELG